MQPLTSAPRDALTDDQVLALLTGPDLHVDFGVELLDAALGLVEDMSADVQSCTVSRDCTAVVHGTLSLNMTRELAWGRDRIRPYMLLANGQLSGRFNLGVYLLTTPDSPRGQTPPTYQVNGFDQLHLLQAFIGDSYSVAAGANVLDAVRAALTAAGVAAPVLLDTTAAASTYPGGKTWPLVSSSSSTDDPRVASGSGGFRWVDVVNGLLAAVGYQNVWCDWDGNFRSGPLTDPSARPVEYVFGVGDLKVGIVSGEGSVANDVWGVPNQWTFYQNGLTSQPVAGVSKYVINNVSTGLASQSSLGRVVPAQPQGLDAVDFASLKSQGDAIAAKAMRTTETISSKLSPFPIAWHLDVARYSDASLGDDRTVLGRSWQLPCDGSDMTYAWETVNS